MTQPTEEQAKYQADVAMAVVCAVVDVREGVVDPNLVFEAMSDAIAMIAHNLDCYTDQRQQRALADDCRNRIRWRMKQLRAEEDAGHFQWRKGVPVERTN